MKCRIWLTAKQIFSIVYSEDISRKDRGIVYLHQILLNNSIYEPIKIGKLVEKSGQGNRVYCTYKQFLFLFSVSI